VESYLSLPDFSI